MAARYPGLRELVNAEHALRHRQDLAAIKAAVHGRGHRLKARRFTGPQLATLEWRELLIREASFTLWRKWWPAIPERQLRASIARCSLAVLIYAAHRRLKLPASLPLTL